MDLKHNLEEIVIKIKILQDKKTKAIISLDFGDFVIKGFRVTESQFENKQGEKLWLIPPSYQSGGRYHTMFFMPNKQIWEELQERIMNEYKKELKNFNLKLHGIKEDDSDSLYF